MKPKGEYENDYRSLLEAIESMSSRYRRLSESRAVRWSVGLRKYMALAKRGRFLTMWRNRRTTQKGKRQNQQMRTAMEARKSQIKYLADAPKEYFSPSRIAVYTALFGKYDDIHEPLIRPDNVDYFILTDQSLPPESCFQRLPIEMVPSEVKGDVARNRWAKMHPHELFADYDYSIYLDASCWIVSDLTPLIATLERFPVAMFPHKTRDCVYDEVAACLTLAKDDPEVLEKHRQALVNHGVPQHAGLLEATVIARKHNESESIAVMEEWWRLFCTYSNRDQISLADCLWQMGIPVERLATLQNCGAGKTVTTCSLFIPTPHNAN